MGMSDLSMADHLYHYIVGGHKIPLVSRKLNVYDKPSQYFLTMPIKYVTSLFSYFSDRSK